MEWDNHKNPKTSFTIVILQWAILELTFRVFEFVLHH